MLMFRYFRLEFGVLELLLDDGSDELGLGVRVGRGGGGRGGVPELHLATKCLGEGVQ